ncbi:hypothetical protein BaRGS_00032324 [Batillaria attramentaria]|uniref:Sulfotransferase domain-containing protein n=1 Tax=Batillaria attramentaria TaxID=370345 RepID=A0ABD0JNJ9_9CAEN
MGQLHFRVVALLCMVLGAGIFLMLYWPAGNQWQTTQPLRTWKCHACGASSPEHTVGTRKIAKQKWIGKMERKTLWTPAAITHISCTGKRDGPAPALARPAGFISPFDYIPGSKNPCWNSSTEDSLPQLNCLPYFFLAGVSKCGSTDIFSRLTEHPQVMITKQKEPRWFDIRRYNKGDGSPTYFWRNYHWALYPGNEGCGEPRVVIPDFIRRLLPDAKIIISFRNPADSLYSKYLQYGDKGFSRSPDHFHTLVTGQIRRYQDCFSHHSVRSCAYNVTLSTETEVRLEKGLYAVFLADWFRIFPPDQFHIIRFEDYVADIRGHLQNMFDFLALDAMPETSLQEVASRPPANRGNHYDVGPMLPVTRQVLEEFYTPFNRRLADLLSDKRFLWPS